ncbi:MAG: Probable transcription regulator Cj0571 [uncultured Sulfurovum sp.]|uniref:Probable transcription regulator Cj0571 n=1 Tax=uncultured Sulfurovum sp. TaxID=269237 RepID=A0A6S6RRK8_9BACT|nr:MAG: Probable transcription regulator Cj0571 [uncultured Sulfurovum sp.]
MTKNIRLLSILEHLSTHPKASVKELALLYNVTSKSIQNDFQILNDYLGDRLLKKGDTYRLLNTDSFSKIFKSNPQTIKRFLQLVSMVDANFYDEFVNDNAELLKELNLNTTSVYQIENSPYEQLSVENKKVLEELASFISHRNYINITYSHSNIDTVVYMHSIPLKILLLKENWYLAVLTTNNVDNNSIFKKLRINFISNVQESKLEPKHFHSDHTEKVKAERFLKRLQSPFSDMDRISYKVVLKVSLEVARYFKSKQYLKSQKLIKELDNGDVLFSYEISNDCTSS